MGIDVSYSAPPTLVYRARQARIYSCSTASPVSAWMGDRMRTGKPTMHGAPRSTQPYIRTRNSYQADSSNENLY